MVKLSLPFVLSALVGCVGGCAVGCDGGQAPSPFAPELDAGPGPRADGSLGDDRQRDAGSKRDAGGLGAPCVDDGQCDDGFDCTFDSCDDLAGRCRHTPDDSVCADDSFCNGVETCDPERGCRPGPLPDCSDTTGCSVESCDEAQRACVSEPRDADSDGDVDINCGGGDCNERDPNVSSLSPEVCNNAVDDDCDGDQDESDCVLPKYDDCTDPLEVSTTTRVTLSPVGARADYGASCIDTEALPKDLVVALVVPEGDPVDIDVIATVSRGDVQLVWASECGDASTEIACAPSSSTPDAAVASRLRLRSPEPGVVPLYVFSDTQGSIDLAVSFEDPLPEPPNETCGTAIPIVEGQPARVSLVDADPDVASQCDRFAGDLLYEFSLEERRDVRITARALDALGHPSLSLRRAECQAPEDEIVCRTRFGGDLFWRDLAPGQYFIGASATGPATYELSLLTLPPSVAPEDDGCEAPPVLEVNRLREVDLRGHIDDIRLGCSAGRVDAAYAFSLTEPGDVLLVERFPEGDAGTVALADASCSAPPIECNASGASPVRVAHHALSTGTYRAVVETDGGVDASITVLSRPARPPVLVAFADACETAVAIPPDGGFFTGTTANARNDYSAGCDLGGLEGEDGAADQMLKLELEEPRRVVLDARGSAYTTLIDVRRGPDCPGSEVTGACSVGFGSGRSYLDLVLDPGEYFVQVDGYAGAEGAWFLEVFVVAPPAN